MPRTIPRTNSDSSATAAAIARQPGLLGLEWTKRLSARARAAAKNAKSITFIGTGTSHHCALWAAELAREASNGRLPARALSTWDFLAEGAAKTAPKSELFVVISHRGARALTKHALEAIGPRRKHVLISAENAPHGTHPFVAGSPSETSSAHTMSLIGALGACSELIATALPAARASQLRAERATAAQLLAAACAKTTELEETLGGLVTRGAALHFIGGGAFYPIARELALKAREIIHIPALAYQTEEFLHGPVAAVNEEDTVVIIPTAPPAGRAPLERKLWIARLAACRQAAEAVGALVLIPGLDPRAGKLAQAWQAVLPLFWGQILCLSTAEVWGLNPDLNRRDDPRYDEAYRLTLW